MHQILESNNHKKRRAQPKRQVFSYNKFVDKPKLQQLLITNIFHLPHRRRPQLNKKLLFNTLCNIISTSIHLFSFLYIYNLTYPLLIWHIRHIQIAQNSTPNIHINLLLLLSTIKPAASCCFSYIFYYYYY